MALYDTNKRNCVVNTQCIVYTSLTIKEGIFGNAFFFSDMFNSPCWMSPRAFSTFFSLFSSLLADYNC